MKRRWGTIQNKDYRQRDVEVQAPTQPLAARHPRRCRHGEKEKRKRAGREGKSEKEREPSLPSCRTEADADRVRCRQTGAPVKKQ